MAVDKAPGMAEFLARKNIFGVTAVWADVTQMVGQSQDLEPGAGFTHALATLVVPFCGDRQTDPLPEVSRAVMPGDV